MKHHLGTRLSEIYDTSTGEYLLPDSCLEKIEEDITGVEGDLTVIKQKVQDSIANNLVWYPVCTKTYPVHPDTPPDRAGYCKGHEIGEKMYAKSYTGSTS
jgi:hypothetical protein